MTTNYGQQVYSQGSGTASTTLLDAVRLPRNPTAADVGYQLGKNWVNTTTNAVWYLANNSSNAGVLQANWVNLGAGSILAGVDTINTVAPDGAGNFTLSSSDASVGISPIVNGLDLTVAISPTKYDGNTGGDVVPNVANQLFIVGNNATGINVVGNSPINTLTISSFQATTIQEGTVTLATNAQAIAGTDAANAVTSSALAAKLGTQTIHSLALFQGSSLAMTPLGAAINGQLPIGSTGLDPVLSTLTAGTGISITNGAGSIAIAINGAVVGETITGTSGGALSPTAGNWNILGASTAAGTTPVSTSGAVSTLTINVQKAQAIAATDATKVGLAAFNSADFTVDANGFVSFSAGTALIQTMTGNSGGALSPTAGNMNTVGTGSITIAGSGSTLTTQLTGLTNHNVLLGAGTATITNVAPSATSGVPLISQGAAADPAFGTAVVAGGGTGITSATAYAVICGGTTSTNPFQSIASVGTSGQILTSNGAGALPTFQSASGSSITLTGDTGGALASGSFTFNANTNCGSSVLFAGAGTTLSLKVTDVGSNTLIGFRAGNGSLSGSANVSCGDNTLFALTSGSSNAAVGHNGQVSVTTGSSNTSLGDSCLNNITTGSTNIGIGSTSGSLYTSSESSNIVIGNTGTVSESNVIRIGTQGSGAGQQNKCFIAGITGVSVSNLNLVTINTATGQLGSQAAANVGTVTQFDVLVGGSSGAIASVGPGASGQVLQSAGNAANPAYSTATYPATATGTGTILRADGTNWVATTSTYPNTNAVSTLLYASSANVMSDLATANRGVLTTGATGIPVITALAADGQVIVGSTAGAPAAATLTAGTGITITNASNSITIATNSAAGVQTLTGNSGGAISPTAGNINTLGTGSIIIAGAGSTLTTQLTGLTNHNVLLGSGTATITNVAPSATSGVPLISQGASADPTFGTAVVAGGGTGNTTFTAYSVICAGTTATGVFQNVSGVGTSGQFLTSNGAGALPTWQTAGAASITITGDSGGALTASSFTFTGGTTGLTFSGAGTTETLTGTLVVSNGGTGRATLTNHGVLIGAGTSAITQLAAATNNQILVGNTSADPSFKAFSVVRQVFTSTGTYTPTSGMIYCDIEVVGGGGGGGGAAATSSQCAAGGGGGGGGYSRKSVSAATIGASQSVTVGNGGTAGTAGNNAGGTGGTVSVGAIVSATGGAGGAGGAAQTITPTNAAGGAGGVGSSGDFNCNGGAGGAGLILYIASVAAFVYGSQGGNSIYGGGGLAVTPANTAGSAGNAGTVYGGGGSGGATNNSNAAVAGGVGGKGIVIVTEYVIS